MSDRVVVIGSGPCGAMAAWALARHRIPVTVLESGTAPPSGWLVRAAGRNLFRSVPPASSSLNGVVKTGHPETTWMEHLGPGGLSNQWTGAVPRFAPADFHEGERLHPRYRWPVTYDDLRPYYAEAEQLLHVTGTPRDAPALPAGRLRHERWLPAGWHRVEQVAAEHGQGLTMLPLADGPDWLVARRGTAFNSFSTILSGLRSRPGFELRTGAHALRLTWSVRRRAIDAVIYYDRATGATERISAAAVVVACGPLRSTKLLFDSACPDFPDGLGNTDGVLGKYLHDHPKEWWTFGTDRPLPRLAPSGYLTRMPYDASAPLMATSWTIGNSCTRDKVLALTPLKAHRFGVQVFGSMIPVEQNFVRPSPSAADQFGLPQLEICIDFDAETVANVQRAREHLIALLDAAGHPSVLDPVEPQLAPGAAVHYGGTARMHRDRRYGVLDAWNRPFDIPNLVVADASCFTTNSEKNPTLTAMALAARAAHRLARDLKVG